MPPDKFLSICLNIYPLLLSLVSADLSEMLAKGTLDSLIRELRKPAQLVSEHRSASEELTFKTYLAFNPFVRSTLLTWLPITASLNSSRSSLLGVFGAGLRPGFEPCVAATLVIGPLMPSAAPTST